MLSIQSNHLLTAPVPLATTWLLSVCMESRGKQDLWIHQKPEVLAALRQQAMIQSTESSNRIEGVTIAPDRLRPVVLGKSRPRDRSEEELAGYRRALNWIYTQKNPPRIEPKIVKLLHQMAQGAASGTAGEWKRHDNEIIEVMPGGERRVRFVPTAAKHVPKAMEQLCLTYADLSHKDQIPPLLTIATFVFDFLCIHPFADGNGRVSRLLTALLLQNHGFVVGRYVSLERLTEETKEDYYAVLGRCSKGWHEGKNELIPWWNYFLSILKRAYGEFERRLEGAEQTGKSELIRQTVLGQSGPFSLAQIQSQCPFASTQLIKKVLSQMKVSRRLRLAGRGRGARWELRR